MKKLIASLLAVFVAAVFGGFAFAASDDVAISFSVLNRATVSNVSVATANSGGNSEDAGTDIEAGMTDTGDVIVSSLTQNDLNYSYFEAEVIDSNDVAVAASNDNDAELGNSNIVAGNSGENTAVAGTDISSSSPGYKTTTGNVEVAAVILNGKDSLLNPLGFGLNYNKTKVVVTDSDDVAFSQTFLNRMTLNNAVLPAANSGMNSHDAGTDIEGGVIVTGDAEASALIQNDLNYNEVDGSVTNSNDVAGAIDANNDFTLDNLATTEVNTGDNTKTAGTDSTGGSITTGAASALKNIINKLNVNKFVFKVL